MSLPKLQDQNKKLDKDLKKHYGDSVKQTLDKTPAECEGIDKWLGNANDKLGNLENEIASRSGITDPNKKGLLDQMKKDLDGLKNKAGNIGALEGANKSNLDGIQKGAAEEGVG